VKKKTFEHLQRGRIHPLKILHYQKNPHLFSKNPKEHPQSLPQPCGGSGLQGGAFPLQRGEALSQKRDMEGRNFQGLTIHLSGKLPKKIVPGEKRIVSSSGGTAAGEHQDITGKGTKKLLHQKALANPSLSRDVHAPGTGCGAFAEGSKPFKLLKTTEERRLSGRLLLSGRLFSGRRGNMFPGKTGKKRGVALPGLFRGEHPQLFLKTLLQMIVDLDHPASSPHLKGAVHHETGNLFIQIIPGQKLLQSGEKRRQLLPGGPTNPVPKPLSIEPGKEASFFPKPGLKAGTSPQGKPLHKGTPQRFQFLGREGFQKFLTFQALQTVRTIQAGQALQAFQTLRGFRTPSTLQTLQKMKIRLHGEGPQKDALPIPLKKS
jgi:hypothetical protein